MRELLTFLATYCSFLFKPSGYRIVDYEVSASFGNALLILESEAIRLRFTRDKSQLLMEFQPLGGRRSEWFSQGLLKGLTGDRGGSEVLTPEWALFLVNRPGLWRLFVPERMRVMTKRCPSELKERAVRLIDSLKKPGRSEDLSAFL